VARRIADLASALTGRGIEYCTADARSTKLTANITTAGLYEFLIDGTELVLTVSGVANAPVLAWSRSNA
jgi:hypothetical protein